jgi:hypothetical protein
MQPHRLNIYALRPCTSNTRICRIPPACVGQPGWRPVIVAAGWPIRARVPARRSASGSRYRPGVCCTQVRGVGGGHPGRGDKQRACRGSAQDRHRVGCRTEPGLGHRDHEMPNSACACAPRPGRPAGSRSAYPSMTSRPSPPRSSRTAAAAGARAGRTRPAGRALPGVPRRYVRRAHARRRHRRPARLPPGPRRCSGTARPRRRTGRGPGGVPVLIS